MLIIERRLNESIFIGPDITVLVTRIGRDKVHLGITAPRELNIAREEMGKPVPVKTPNPGAAGKV